MLLFITNTVKWNAAVLLILMVLFLLLQQIRHTSIKNIWLQRIATMVVLIGAFFICPADIKSAIIIPVHTNTIGWNWLIIAGAVIISVNNKLVQQNKFQQLYAYYRDMEWNVTNIFFHNLSCIFYLVFYELFFRGWMFQLHQLQFGMVTAFIINLLLYAVLHIPKGKNEVIGSLFFGTMLCVATVESGSVFSATGLHLVMALSFENFMISHYLKQQKQTI
jgi:membrane protease YdiL (CAAX protease family)